MSAPNVPPAAAVDGDQILHQRMPHSVNTLCSRPLRPMMRLCGGGVPPPVPSLRGSMRRDAPNFARETLREVPVDGCCRSRLPPATHHGERQHRCSGPVDHRGRPPTLMVDEADTIFGTKKAAENNEDVRGILNAGHQRNRPYVGGTSQRARATSAQLSLWQCSQRLAICRTRSWTERL
jgi:hypothetical protein